MGFPGTQWRAECEQRGLFHIFIVPLNPTYRALAGRGTFRPNLYLIRLGKDSDVKSLTNRGMLSTRFNYF
jgi:hypothetical protein